jgi:hypothetical protein
MMRHIAAHEDYVCKRLHNAGVPPETLRIGELHFDVGLNVLILLAATSAEA